jgi:transposase-like protein
MSMLTARPRRSFTPEFTAQTIELVRPGGKSVAEVCRDLDLTETAVRRWIAQADIDAGRRDATPSWPSSPSSTAGTTSTAAIPLWASAAPPTSNGAPHLLPSPPDGGSSTPS